MPLTQGSLYRYNYLWSRQHERHEVSGRKARPVCLVVRTPANPAVLYLFPLTSRLPASDAASLEVPEHECRRAGLARPCWIILDEYNRTAEDEAYDFESLDPLGSFSRNFLRRIGAEIARAASDRRLKGVARDT